MANAAQLALLSDRERQCFRLVARGMTAKEIAVELNLSPHTVQAFIRSGRSKLSNVTARQAARLLVASEGGGEPPTNRLVSSSIGIGTAIPREEGRPSASSAPDANFLFSDVQQARFEVPAHWTLDADILPRDAPEEVRPLTLGRLAWTALGAAFATLVLLILALSAYRELSTLKRNVPASTQRS